MDSLCVLYERHDMIYLVFFIPDPVPLVIFNLTYSTRCYLLVRSVHYAGSIILQASFSQAGQWLQLSFYKYE